MPSRKVVIGQLWMAIARGLGGMEMDDTAAQAVWDHYININRPQPPDLIDFMRQNWQRERANYLAAAVALGASLAQQARAAKATQVTGATPGLVNAFVPCLC